MVSVVKRWTHGPTYASFQGQMKFLCLLCQKLGTKKTEITESTSRIALTLGFLRAVTKISRCQVNTTSRRGIKQLGISFGSIFRLFSYESSRGNPRPPPLNDSPGRGKGRKKWNRGKALPLFSSSPLPAPFPLTKAWRPGYHPFASRVLKLLTDGGTHAYLYQSRGSHMMFRSFMLCTH